MQDGIIDSFTHMPAMNGRRSARYFCRVIPGNIVQRHFYIIKNRLNRQLFFGLLRKMKYMYAELQEKRIIGSIFLRRTKTTNIGILR